MPAVALLLLLALPIPGSIAAQAKPDAAAKIANAMKAAPSSIAEKATIMDWPAKEGAEMTTLRKGTNGWTCLPDFPATEGDDPMCLDDQWMGWMQALTTKKPPQTKRAGIGYMIAPGGAYGSNTDPFATKKTPDNDWGFDPPHIMLLVTDPKSLEGLPTKRQSGGPWVMWVGTPYVHIMVPVASPKK
jgi:hypothetical protein